MVDETM